MKLAVVLLCMAFVALSTAVPVEHIKLGNTVYTIPYGAKYNSRVQREFQGLNERRYESTGGRYTEMYLDEVDGKESQTKPTKKSKSLLAKLTGELRKILI